MITAEELIALFRALPEAEDLDEWLEKRGLDRDEIDGFAMWLAQVAIEAAPVDEASIMTAVQMGVLIGIEAARGVEA